MQTACLWMWLACQIKASNMNVFVSCLRASKAIFMGHVPGDNPEIYHKNLNPNTEIRKKSDKSVANAFATI